MHEAEGATWCGLRRRDGRPRQAEASPACVQTRGRVRLGRGRCREHRRQGGEGLRAVEGRGGTGLAGPQPEQGAATGAASAAGKGINGISEYIFRYSVNWRQDRPINGVRRGTSPSELTKGVQGETAAICRVPLHPFLYAAPRAAGRGR